MNNLDLEIANCERCGAELRGDLCEICCGEINHKNASSKNLRLKRILKLSAAVIILSCILLWLNPLFRLRSKDMIRQSILQETPLGLYANQVENHIKARWPSENILLSNKSGNKSIGPVELSWYWTYIPGLPVITYVYAEWVFNQNGQLIDVVVKKEVDAP